MARKNNKQWIYVAGAAALAAAYMMAPRSRQDQYNQTPPDVRFISHTKTESIKYPNSPRIVADANGVGVDINAKGNAQLFWSVLPKEDKKPYDTSGTANAIVYSAIRDAVAKSDQSTLNCGFTEALGHGKKLMDLYMSDAYAVVRGNLSIYIYKPEIDLRALGGGPGTTIIPAKGKICTVIGVNLNAGPR